MRMSSSQELFKRSRLHAVLGTSRSGKTTLLMQLLRATGTNSCFYIGINRDIEDRLEALGVANGYDADERGDPAAFTIYPATWPGEKVGDDVVPKSLKAALRDHFQNVTGTFPVVVFDGLEKLIPRGRGATAFVHSFLSQLERLASDSEAAIVVVLSPPKWLHDAADLPYWCDVVSLTTSGASIDVSICREYERSETRSFAFAAGRLVEESDPIVGWFRHQQGECALVAAMQGLVDAGLINSLATAQRKINALVAEGRLLARQDGRRRLLTAAV